MFFINFWQKELFLCFNIYVKEKAKGTKMEAISSLAFGASPKVLDKTDVKETPTNQNKVEDKEAKEKALKIASIGISALAIAGIAIAAVKKGKAAKLKDAAEIGKDLAGKRAGQAVPLLPEKIESASKAASKAGKKPILDASQKADKMRLDYEKLKKHNEIMKAKQLEHGIRDKAAQELRAAQQERRAAEQAREGVRQIIEEGKSKTQVQKTATRNLDKSNKGFVKKALREAADAKNPREFTMTRKQAKAFAKAEAKSERKAAYEAKKAAEEAARKQAEAKKAAALAERLKDPKQREAYAKEVAEAQKLAARKAAREANKIKTMPGYKKALQDLQRKGFGQEKLQRIVNNSQNKYEVAAAQDLLAKMAK